MRLRIPVTEFMIRNHRNPLFEELCQIREVHKNDYCKQSPGHPVPVNSRITHL